MAKDDTIRRIADLPPEKRALLERQLMERAARRAADMSIPRRKAAGPCVLSFTQQRLWFLAQLDPESPAYNVGCAFRLRGVLNVAALTNALDALVSRHEALRTRFISVSGAPMQVAEEEASVNLRHIDLSGTPQALRESEAQRVIRAELRRPFDLSKDVLLRASLMRLASDEHILCLGTHHISSDGWSVGVMLRELSALYGAFAEGRPSPLPHLPIKYADFACWQREWMQGKLLDDHLAFWRKLLGAEPHVLELPADRVRPAAQTYAGAQYHFALPAELHGALAALGRREGATLFMTLLAAYRVLLHRYTGKEDIVVGVPIANRNRLELEGLIGFFANTLALPSDLSGNPTFRDMLKRERETDLGAYAHQDMPFDKLVEELRPEREMSRTPLVQVMFGLLSRPVPAPELTGLEVSRTDAYTGTAKFDLSLDMVETPEGMTARFEYSTDLFDEDTIARMAGHFRVLIEGIVADPDRGIGSLPLLTPQEERQILVEWNDTAADHASDALLHGLFEEQAARTPEAAAVTFEGESLTFCELNRRSNQLAHRLRRMGVGPDALVGVCMERSLELVVALLGVLKAGGAYVPLDPEYPKERLAFMIEDAGARVLLTQTRLLPNLPAHGAQVICMDAAWQAEAGEDEGNPASTATAESMAYVIYTSGSTGKPKGAMLTHRSICNHMLWMLRAFPMTASDRVLQKTSISFDASVWEFYLPLISGAQLVMAPPGAHRDSYSLVEAIAKNRITDLQMVPSMLRLLVEEKGFTECCDLKRIFSGGEALPSELQDRIFSRTKAELYNLYGPTETTIDATFWKCRREAGQGPVPIGRPIPGNTGYILDQHMQPVPIRVPGELYIGGAGVGRGYLKRPELTAERFVPDPFSKSAAARMYRTGDLCRFRSDGNIEYLGRKDHQVKVRGFRIELGEIEAALAEHPAVKEAVVVVREDSPGVTRLVSYLVAKTNPAPTARELGDSLSAKLPAYMVPSSFTFMPALPLTPSGKVDPKALPAPDLTSRAGEAGYVEPRNMMERQLAHIWQSVLGVPRVGVLDNFFDLGGHSLLAVYLFTQIEKTFGRRLPLATLFRAPTVEQLAAILRQEGWSEMMSPLVGIRTRGSRRPFFCVASMDAFAYAQLAQRLGDDQPFYALQPLSLINPEQPRVDIKSLAARYAQEIRGVQAEGPYLLGGMCAGGVIAYEVAQQLRKAGQEVALLALIDTPLPTGALIKQVNFLSQRLVHHARTFWHLERGQKWDYARARLRTLKHRLLRQPGPVDDAAPETALVEAYWRPVRAAYLRALPRYSPAPYRGQIALFIGEQTQFGFFFDPRIAWSKLAVGRLDVHMVPGDHTNILREPQVLVLAEKLGACLGRAQRLTEQGVASQG